jgi:hypothetical protein
MLQVQVFFKTHSPLKAVVILKTVFQLNELQYDSVLLSSYKQEALTLWSQTCLNSEISSSHGSEYEVQKSLMIEAVRTSETSVDNYFTRQYIPEDNSELSK